MGLVSSSSPTRRHRSTLLLLVTLLATLLVGLGTAPAAQAALKPPASVTLRERTTTSMALQWSAVSGAPAYRVKYSTTSDYQNPVYRSVSKVSTTFKGLKPATTYFVKVRVVTTDDVELTGYSPTLKVTTLGTTSTEPNPNPGGRPLRVASYNVRCASCYEGKPDEGTWEERRSSVVATIKAQDLDVLGVQEASQGWLKDANGDKFSLSQFEDLTNRLGDPWKLANTKRNNCVKDTTPSKCVYKDQGASLGTKILYNSDRVKLLDNGSKLLPETDEEGTRHYVAWAQLQQINTGTKFMLANAHLTAYDGNYQLRKDQMTAAYADVKANTPSGWPVIALGDWNSSRFADPTNAPYDVWIKAGLVDPLGGAYDTSKTAPGATVEKRIQTWVNSTNGFLRHPKTHPTWINGSYVDYILTTPMRVSEWETVAKLDSAGDLIGRIPSDHNLIRATVYLPPVG